MKMIILLIKIKQLLNAHNPKKNMPMSFKDLNDFRVPVDIFTEYSETMKAMNKECQQVLMRALGINLSQQNAKIDWETFIQFNCLLKFESATVQE